jgi:hypothetical protein
LRGRLKEDLAELFDLLRKPMETVLEFVARTTDLVKVKNQYTILYKTGLIVIYRLLRPHRVLSNMEVKFGHLQGFISGICSTSINALYTIAHQHLTNPGLFHHQFPVYAEKIAAKTGYFSSMKLSKGCVGQLTSKRQPTAGTSTAMG